MIQPFCSCHRLECVLSGDTRAALSTRYGRNARRAIVNVADTAGFQPTPYMAVYGATKAFVSHSQRRFGPKTSTPGVRVLALCPGPVDTAFFKV